MLGCMALCLQILVPALLAQAAPGLSRAAFPTQSAASLLHALPATAFLLSETIGGTYATVPHSSAGASGRRSKAGGATRPRRRSKGGAKAALAVPPVADVTLQHMLAMRRSLATVAAAQQLGLFDSVRDAPFTIQTVAERLSITMRAAEAMIATLASLSLAVAQDDGTFVLSDEAQVYLISDSSFFRPSLLDQEDLPRFEQTKAALTSEDARVVTPFAVNLKNMELAEVEGFVNQMHTFTLPAAPAVGSLGDFANISRLLDVGGGSGSLSIGVASRNPGVSVTLLDLAQVCTIAHRHIAEFGVSASVQTLAGSMFDPLPRGFDGMMFGNVFHDWSWETCTDLARRSFEALEPGGTIFVHEMLLWPKKDGPLTVAAFSMDMLVHELGKQFTQAELESLLQNVGFVDVRTTPTFGHYSMVMGKKP